MKCLEGLRVPKLTWILLIQGGIQVGKCFRVHAQYNMNEHLSLQRVEVRFWKRSIQQSNTVQTNMYTNIIVHIMNYYSENNYWVHFRSISLESRKPSNSQYHLLTDTETNLKCLLVGELL